MSEKREPACLYLCDRKKCENCHPEVCIHTSDINHAMNRGHFNGFEELGGDFWEKEYDGCAES